MPSWRLDDFAARRQNGGHRYEVLLCHAGLPKGFFEQLEFVPVASDAPRREHLCGNQIQHFLSKQIHLASPLYPDSLCEDTLPV